MSFERSYHMESNEIVKEILVFLRQKPTLLVDLMRDDPTVYVAP